MPFESELCLTAGSQMYYWPVHGEHSAFLPRNHSVHHFFTQRNTTQNQLRSIQFSKGNLMQHWDSVIQAFQHKCYFLTCCSGSGLHPLRYFRYRLFAEGFFFRGKNLHLNPSFPSWALRFSQSVQQAKSNFTLLCFTSCIVFKNIQPMSRWSENISICLFGVCTHTRDRANKSRSLCLETHALIFKTLPSL